MVKKKYREYRKINSLERKGLFTTNPSTIPGNHKKRFEVSLSRFVFPLHIYIYIYTCTCININPFVSLIFFSNLGRKLGPSLGSAYCLPFSKISILYFLLSTA